MVYYNSRQEVPYTGRMHSIMVNAQTEKMLGEQTYHEVVIQSARVVGGCGGDDGRRAGAHLWSGGEAWHSGAWRVRHLVGSRCTFSGSDHTFGPCASGLQILREAQHAGRLLPPHHRASALVRHVGMRIAQSVADEFGGGEFRWMGDGGEERWGSV